MTEIKVPDFMPMIYKGPHDDPAHGACVMEYISLIAGEDFSDMPNCVWYPLRNAAITVNDVINDDDERTRIMLPLIHRLIGSAEPMRVGTIEERWERSQMVMRGLLVAEAQWLLAHLRVTTEQSRITKERLASLVRMIELAATFPVEEWENRVGRLIQAEHNPDYGVFYPISYSNEVRDYTDPAGKRANIRCHSLWRLLEKICSLSLVSFFALEEDDQGDQVDGEDWTDSFYYMRSGFTPQELGDFMTAMLDEFERLTGWHPLSEDEIHNSLIQAAEQVPQPAKETAVN